MISLLQLQYFRAVAQEGNLTRAAQKLCVSQTTLSVMLTKMEKELGTQLFDRKNNRLWLNACGESYLVHVCAALGELEQGQRELERKLQENSGTLRVCSSSDYVWEELILRFTQVCPHIHMAHYHDRIEKTGEKIRSGEIDFVITGLDDIHSDDVEHMVVGSTGLCVCVPQSHPFSTRKEIALAELDGVPMVSLTADAPFQQFLNKLLEQAGVTPMSAVECGYKMRPRYTAQGMGVAVTNDAQVCRDIFPGHSFIPVSDEMAHRDIALYWEKGRAFTPAMSRFRDFLLEYMDEMAP